MEEEVKESPELREIRELKMAFGMGGLHINHKTTKLILDLVVRYQEKGGQMQISDFCDIQADVDSMEWDDSGDILKPKKDDPEKSCRRASRFRGKKKIDYSILINIDDVYSGAIWTRTRNWRVIGVNEDTQMISLKALEGGSIQIVSACKVARQFVYIGVVSSSLVGIAQL